MKKYQSYNECPKCGSGDISWLVVDIISDGIPMHQATCNECDCSFEEVYKYNYTRILE